MTGWREKRREARWKRKARMRNLERINKNKKCLAAKIIWICSRLPWRRELKYTYDEWFLNDEGSPSVKAWVEISQMNLIRHRLKVAFREGVSWNVRNPPWSGLYPSRLPWRRELKWDACTICPLPMCRLPWRRELKCNFVIVARLQWGRLPWRRELKFPP